MYHQFNIHKLYVLPTQCIYVFCVDLRTNSDFSLYNINWLVCITEIKHFKAQWSLYVPPV